MLAAEQVMAGTVEANCRPCYLFGDHLGSTRVMTAADGTVVKRSDYLPFGEELNGIAGRSATNFYVPAAPAASGLAYAGVGVHSPAAAATAGVVGFGSGRNVSGVGLYGEGFLWVEVAESADTST